jgi:hypothetical protein
VTLIHRYFPDSDETIKGHLKGQRQGIRLTKQIALEKIIENEEVRQVQQIHSIMILAKTKIRIIRK